MKVCLKQIYKNAQIIFTEKKIPDPATEAFYLMNAHIPCNRGELLLGVEREVDPEAIDRFMIDVSKRVQGMPLQYLIGKWEFYGLEFLTLPGVLIPRADTETLIDYALPVLKAMERPRILDLCCGSGCIGLTLAKLIPQLDVTLFDISAAAIDATRRNAALHRLEDRCHIVQGDVMLAGTNYFPDDTFDMILSNPPYIKTADLSALAKEVQQEPTLALDGGMDGLTFYRAIAADWTTPLKEGGHLVLEAGYDTTQPVAELLKEYPFNQINTHKDLGQNDRMITAVLGGKEK
ncbi:MAG: peptide chain release factor N(5)-glutamine methyltransferase [Clostridia bacterium]|nr:peptide chain release factor N(5)-glutamine methyltransferase [Clostridia bacterium]